MGSQHVSLSIPILGMYSRWCSRWGWNQCLVHHWVPQWQQTCCLSSSPQPSLPEIVPAFHWRHHLLHVHCKHHTPPFPSHMRYPMYARLRLTMGVSYFIHSHHNPLSQPKYYPSSIYQSSTFHTLYTWNILLPKGLCCKNNDMTMCRDIHQEKLQRGKLDNKWWYLHTTWGGTWWIRHLLMSMDSTVAWRNIMSW